MAAEALADAAHAEAKRWAELPRAAYHGQVRMNRGERLGRLAEAIAADRGRTFEVSSDFLTPAEVRGSADGRLTRCFRRREEASLVNAVAVVWLILLPAAAFYFLLWRPQQRRMAAVRVLQSALDENDEVMTTSGIYGRVTRLGEDDADLEIAPGTVIRVARGAIAQRIVGDDLPDAHGEDSEAN